MQRTFGFYILTDCVNLSEEIDETSIGLRCDSQVSMERMLSESYWEKFNKKANLPVYTFGMEMEPNQLYKTNKMGNEYCCFKYVIKTDKIIKISEYQGSKYDIINVDRKMISEMFKK